MVNELNKNFIVKTKSHLDYFCNNLGDRYVGSKSNQEAAKYIKDNLLKSKVKIEEQRFECFDWQGKNVIFKVDDEEYEANISPYSPNIETQAELVTVANLEELREVEGKDKIVLLTDELVKEQLVPKNFPFYQLEEHQEIIKLLENKGFKAVIAATGKDMDTAGGLYPFPLIEDGDFKLPSIYIKDVVGEEIKNKKDKEVYLKIDTKKEPSQGKNIIATLGANTKDKVVLFAHLDSKVDSPGAIDNATGVTTLMLLAELLKYKKLDKKIEIAILNGEDYYSNPGQRLYFLDNREKLNDIVLGINIDGMGYIKGKTAFSVYTTDEKINILADKVFEGQYDMVRGEPWYQGEHAILVQSGIPSLAFTSELLEEIMSKVHTKEDNLKIIDYQKVVDTSQALSELIINL